MALTEKQKKQLDKLDLTKGGGFYNFASNAHKSEILKDKFLFIGLGGKGVQTLGSLKTAIARNIKIDGGGLKPENVDYLAIDTDKTELSSACRKGLDNVGLDYVSETCQLYSDTASKSLEEGRIPDNISEWKNEKLSAKLKGEGANGIRQAARYLLFYPDGFTTVKSSLEGKLMRLSNLYNGTGKLIVYILSGVSGGTGSGCFIDIAYIVRELCRRNGFNVKLEGYIFLPDSYPLEAQEEHLKYNAYAALKELDFYMGIGNQPSAYFDATYMGGWSVHCKDSIFNVCNLITGSIQGRGRRANPDRFSRQVAIDHILNLMIKSEVDTNQFLINSFLDNDATMIANRVSTFDGTIPRNANYTYNVIGIGAVNLPLEQILSYVSKKAFDKLVEVWDHEPKSLEVDQLLEQLNIYPSRQFNQVMANSKVGFITYQKKMLSPSKEEVINGTAFRQIQQLWMARNVELSISLDYACNGVLSDLLSNFNGKADAMLLDPDRGLFYSVKFLGHVAEQEGDLNGFLQRVRTDVLGEVDGLVGGALSNQANIKADMGEIEGELGRFTLFSGSKIEEYVELCVAYYVEESKKEVYRRIGEKLNEFIGYVEERLRLYQNFADSFWGISDIFDSNFRCVKEGKAETEDYHQNLLDFSHSDEATKKVIEYLDKLLEEKQYRGMVVRLAEMMKQHVKELSGEDEFNPMYVYTRFIENEFQEIPDATIEKLISVKYGENGFQQGVAEICEGLYNASKVIFDPIPTFPLEQLSAISYVTVPKAAVDLVNEVQTYAAMRGARVATSSNLNSIVWYKLICGVPLFSIGKVAEYEESYEHAVLKAGMHLCETPKRDWRKFPNLYNKVYWEQENKREQKIIDEVEANVDKFLEWGILYENNDGAERDYRARLLKSTRIDKDRMDAFLTQYCTGFHEDEDGNFLLGGHLFAAICDFFEGEEESVYPPTVYEKKDLPGLKRMVRMNWLLYLRMKDQMQIYQAFADEIVEKNRMGQFINLWSTGLIREEDGFYIFSDAMGRETELLFTEDLTRLEREYGLYYRLFQNFMKKVDADMMAGLDEVVSEIKHDRSKAAKLRETKQLLLGECEAKLAELNRVLIQREFKNQGKEQMMEEMKSFYTRVHNLG